MGMKSYHKVLFGSIGIIVTVALCRVIDDGLLGLVGGVLASTPFIYVVWKELDAWKVEKYGKP